MSTVAVPRIVVAGVSSGVGKTTTVVGLTRALRARGLSVAVFKCGPDYLDPTYHALAAGRPSHNLDGWMMGREAVCSTFARAAAGVDVAILEGMMGLFDGISPNGDAGSTAEIAKWLEAPVVLVADASGMARSIAALAHGFETYDPALEVAGVVCNRIGGRGHLDLLRHALSSPEILGGLPFAEEIRFPERHLGLVTASRSKIDEGLFDAVGKHVAEWIDLDRVLEIARSAPALEITDGRGLAFAFSPEASRTEAASGLGWMGPRGCAEGGSRVDVPERCRIGLAEDEAFHFYYDDNLARLEALGARLVRFSPIHDHELPDVDALYLGGGYPEVHAEALAANHEMRAAVLAFAKAGGPVYAECGGLMYLARSIRDLDGRSHAMVGLVPGEALMRGSLQALGYVEVETRAPTILGPAGLRFRGHEFRYSVLDLTSEPERAYSVRRGERAFAEGYRVGSVLASYVHAHWASNPLVAVGQAARASYRRR